MEIQAIVMAAGGGSRMSSLTTRMPKALLPVANMPLIWYPVHMLERAGFPEALVIVSESHHSSIQKALEQICGVKITLEFVTIPDDEDWGTVESLRHIRDKIHGDMLVVSCDLICDIELHLLADLHRTKNATVTMLLGPVPDLTEASVPCVKKKIENDVVGLDKENRVLFISREDFLGQTLPLKKSFLQKFTAFDIRKLIDSHLYLMKKSVLDYVVENSSGLTEDIVTLKDQLIPHLVRKQLRRKTFSPPSNLNTTTESRADASPCENDEIYQNWIEEHTTHSDNYSALKDKFHGDKIRCYALIADSSICLRVDTLVTYCEANRLVPKYLQTLAPDLNAPLVASSIKIPNKSTVGADCMMGEGCTIGEKSSIKRSVIGKHCFLCDKVKITNSVVMDHVTIEADCSISGCIVCADIGIGEKCELKDCLLATKIPQMSKYTNEVIDN